MKKVKWVLNSRYAVVSCFSKDDTLWVEKMISPNGSSLYDSHWINDVSLRFREQLEALLVPLATPYLFETKDKFSIQTSPYIGPDIEKFFSLNRLNKANKLSAVEKMISVMSGVLAQGPNPIVGIDPRLSNFCISEKGKVYYVDTFPPLVKYNGEYIVHFPNPTSAESIRKEISRKFDGLGILRRFRFSILELDCNITEKEILLAVKNVMGNNFYVTVENFFSSLPSKSLTEISSLEDVDTIREIAISKATLKTGKVREAFLGEIFELSSSFGALELSHEEKLSRIVKLLK